ncbi:hypothetical protein DSL92_08250 [Billgrantia gudaonensis]|uniref:Uncharacterized protein n=1 Tax=Billgrantia gudaonensis TaxID=376427 RepID=A0A432JGF5_9GAMM|nr:hypothetical protein DSL92_08250 [Halomonas gudaonensis]
MPVAPRQLPFHAGYTYFRLDRQARPGRYAEWCQRFCLPRRRRLPRTGNAVLGDQETKP